MQKAEKDNDKVLGAVLCKIDACCSEKIPLNTKSMVAFYAKPTHQHHACKSEVTALVTQQ